VRLAELAKQQAEALRKAEAEKAAAEAARAAAEKARQAELAKAREDMLAKAAKEIEQKVERVWIRPASSDGNLKCTLRVSLLSSGEVMNVSIVKSSGDDMFDRSAENAVKKASPLPVPNDRELFNSKFKNFVFEFEPH
jgi:colicin import membrane protein